MSKNNMIELLAPAGSPLAGYAALAYGADAVYLGLQQFSARADADNFSWEELSDFIGYAHSLEPKHKVYVTLNTLLKDSEIPDMIACLLRLERLGIDAIITQDEALVYLVKHYFPSIALHASTQMALHNLAGAKAAQEMGFERVVLARELTLREIREIAKIPHLELEIFVHGALCYAYSGLCLLSSMLRGRSGNRGACAYNCRNGYRCEQSSETDCYAMSMKDLAIDSLVNELRSAGVASLKIEGRKKSPTYVAAAVHYYRSILDHLPQEEIVKRQHYLQTIFSRPQTHFFMDNAIQNVVESEVVGHLGAKIGQVEAYQIGRLRKGDSIRFTPSIDLMVYDGLQLPIPDRFGKPFGFSIDKLYPIKQQIAQAPVFESEAGQQVEVTLPPGHPKIDKGMDIYCASSQKVKNELRFEVPKPGLYKVRFPLDLVVTMQPKEVCLTAKYGNIKVEINIETDLTPAKNIEKVNSTLTQNLGKLGDSRFYLHSLEINNDLSLFAPTSMINSWRRDLVELLERQLDQQEQEQVEVTMGLLQGASQDEVVSEARFILKIDQFSYLDHFTEADLAKAAEVMIDIGRCSMDTLVKELPNKIALLGGKLRLALPTIVRDSEQEELAKKIKFALSNKVEQWQVSNISGFNLLPKNSKICGDFSLNILNTVSAKYYLEDQKCQRITISPEASKRELEAILAQYSQHSEVILYQDTPLAFSQSCIHANMNHGCVGKNNCSFTEKVIQSNKGESLLAVNQNCRTILVNQLPFTLVPFMKSLQKMGALWWRCDFCWRSYDPQDVLERWRKLTTGILNVSGYHGNFINGL